MKLYLLHGTKGSWDSFEKFNIGIYNSHEKAEEEKQKLIKELTILSNKYTPEEAEKYEDEIEEIFYGSSSSEEDDQIKLPDYLEEFRNWEFRFKFEEYNLKDFKITEMEINQSYFKHD